MGSTGGGGGIFSGKVSPSNLARQVRQAEDKARDAEFEARVSDLINSSLDQVNNRDTKAVERHLEEIRNALSKEIEGSISLLYAGSVAKHTYVDGLSDVDALVLLNKSELSDYNPAQVREYFAERLRERFPRSPVEVGDLAVTIAFEDVKIQLLPALRTGTGLRISLPGGDYWSPIINPDRFANKLTSVNQRLNGKLVPTIKLAKSVLYQLPEQQRAKSYHVESLAIEVFEGYNGPQTTKSMLRYFFIEAPAHIRQPIKDSTGQSVHVDDYLGGGNSLHRRIVSDAVGRIGRAMQNADGARSVDEWRNILEP